MKKTLVLLLTLLTVFTVAACDNGNEEEQDPDLARVKEAKSRLVIPERLGHVDDDVTLVSQLGFYPDVDITWESSHPDLITPNGEVSRPVSSESNVRVTLTATLSLEDASVTRMFNVLVIAQDE